MADQPPVLSRNLVVLDLDAANTTDVLLRLADQLQRHEYVKETYSESVVAREERFPTGLVTNGVGVAIPHTDCEHVRHPGVSVGVLARPVEFKAMGNPDDLVPVGIVFMLAIKNPDDQIELLQKLMEIIQDEAVLLTIKESRDPSQVVDILNPRLKFIANQSIA